MSEDIRKNNGDHKPISRRKLLATMGIAGGAALLYGSSLVNGNEESATTLGLRSDDLKKLELTSINDLRSANPKKFTLYYIVDHGMKGFFYHDPQDSSSADNLGTVLVSADGSRFKRIIADGRLNVRWFGAIGHGSKQS